MAAGGGFAGTAVDDIAAGIGDRELRRRRAGAGGGKGGRPRGAGGKIVDPVGQAGGTENATWLLAIGKSPTGPAARRRRVVNLLGKFDDPKIREALKGLIER